MNRANLLVVGVLLGFLVGMLALFGVSRFQLAPKTGDLTNGPVSNGKLELNATAPDFRLENLNGELIHLQTLRGKTVIINFWATWCGPCRLEMPAFQSRVEKYPHDLVILAVNGQDTPEAAGAFMEELGLTFDVLLDKEGDIHRQYLVRGFPTTYLVDPDGTLRIQHVGLMTEGQLDDYLLEIGLGN